jgi:hypothetical protein
MKPTLYTFERITPLAISRVRASELVQALQQVRMEAVS